MTSQLEALREESAIRKAAKDIRNAQIFSLSKDGLSSGQIARKLEMPSSTVLAVLGSKKRKS